ncbi:MAG: Kanadaptin [Marteilia pararefringens]
MNLLQQGSLAPQTRRHYKLNLQDLELKKSKTESYLELSKPFMMTSDEYASILENPFEFTSKSQTANKHEAFNLTEFHEPENDSNLEQSSIIQSDEDQRAAKCGKLSPIKQAASKTNNIICVESKSPVGVSRNNCDESSTALIHEHSDSHTKDSECETKYSTWQPPVNQKGDGFTHLNEKYGY